MKRNTSFLLVSLLSLATFVLLFFCRSYDDNRLTSWQWMFEAVSPAGMFLLQGAGIGLAYVVSTRSFSGRLAPGLLFLGSFGVAALFWKVPEAIVDASRYFTQAKHLELYGVGYFFREWGNAIQSWTDLPLMPLLYGMIFRTFGEVRLYAQLFTTGLFSMTVVLTYLMGKLLWDEETGLLGGAFLLCMPYLLSQVPLMLVDVPTMFFLLLTIFTFTLALKQGGLAAAGASVSLFCVLFSKYSSWPMLSVLAVVLAVSLMEARPGERKRISVRAAWIIGSALAAALSVVIVKREVFAAQIRLLSSFQGPGLRIWGESFLSTFFFQVHPFVTMGALFSLYAAFRKRDMRYLIIGWLVLLLVVFQVKRIRYTVPLFPLVALMASYGLRQISDITLRRFIVLCALVSSVTVAVAAYRPFLEKISTVNLARAGDLLNSLKGETVEVYTLPQEDAVLNPAIAVPLLDLSTRKTIVYRYEPSSFPHTEETATSALRFTWEYRNPPYYNGDAGPNAPVVLLSNEPVANFPVDVQERLKGYRLAREFGVYEGVYSFRVTAAVYEKNPGSRER